MVYLRLAIFVGMTLAFFAMGNFLVRTRRTTISFAAVWAAFALCVVATGIVLDKPELEMYCTWCVTFCPALYVLGAKRPQHLGWNAVVLALLGLLVYPAIQSTVMRPGEKLVLGNIWPWFLVAMLLVAPAAYFATRYSLAALLVGVGQAVFFLPYLPFAGGYGKAWEFRPLAAFGLLVLAVAVAQLSYRNRRETLHSADAIWLDFRDTFGIFWGLRFAERINEAAERFGWPVRLEWGGFVVVPHDSPVGLQHDLRSALDLALAAELRPTMRGLLRRFVDQNWIEERLNGKAAETTGDLPR